MAVARRDEGGRTETRARSEDEPRADHRGRWSDARNVGGVVHVEHREESGERHVVVDQPDGVEAQGRADRVEIEAPGRVGEARGGVLDPSRDRQEGRAHPDRVRPFEIGSQGRERIGKAVRAHLPDFCRIGLRRLYDREAGIGAAHIRDQHGIGEPRCGVVERGRRHGGACFRLRM